MAKPSETVTARLDAETLGALDKARSRFGDSRGEYTRRILLMHLFQENAEHLNQEIAEIRMSGMAIEGRLSALQKSMRKLALVLLTTQEPLPMEQAKELAVRMFAQVENQ